MLKIIQMFFKKEQSPRKVTPSMDQNDIDAILAFAISGQNREQAIAAYRRNLSKLHGADNVFMLFMGEVDTTSPDLFLRSAYRKAILAKVP